VAEVAEGGGKDGNDGSGKVGRGTVSKWELEEEVGEDGERDEFGERTYAVDGEAAEPLFEVVAVGMEDEVFVAEKGHRNANRLGGSGGEYDGEGEIAMREEVVVEEDEGGVEDEAEDGVPDAYDEVTKDL
jgi:hypothetical protein